VWYWKDEYGQGINGRDITLVRPRGGLL